MRRPAARSPIDPPLASKVLALEEAQPLQTCLAIIDQLADVTLEERRRVSASLEPDAERGRELLYLIAHDAWILQTTETLSLPRVDMLQTRLEIDVDLSRVGHLALRGVAGRLWIPIAVMPRFNGSGPAAAQDPARGGLWHRWWERAGRRVLRGSRGAAPPRTPEGLPPVTAQAGTASTRVVVHDASHEREQELPPTEVTRQVASALAGLLIEVLVHKRRPGSTTLPPVLGREHQVILAAAIARALQEPFGRSRTSAHWLGTAPEQLTMELGTTDPALHALVAALLAEIEDQESTGNQQHLTLLGSRAVEVLSVLRTVTLVVVPIRIDRPRASFTVQLPPQECRFVKQRIGPIAWLFGARSRALLDLEVLGTQSQTNRVIRCDLPPGAELLTDRATAVLGLDGPSDPTSRPVAEVLVDVMPPRQMSQLHSLIRQLRPPRRTGPPAADPTQAQERWAGARVLGLAGRRAQVLRESLSAHYVVEPGETVRSAETPSAGGRPQVLAETERLRHVLRAVEDLAARPPTDLVGAGPGAIPIDRRIAEVLQEPRQWRRRFNVVTAPDAVEFHMPTVEESVVQARQVSARIRVGLRAGGTDTLAVASSVNAANALVLAVVTALLCWFCWGDRSTFFAVYTGSAGTWVDDRLDQADVLATLLAIFPSIQASRLPRLDDSQVIGRLTAGHSLWGMFTAAPSLAMAALLMLPLHARLLPTAAAVATALQLSIGAMLWSLLRARPTRRVGWLVESRAERGAWGLGRLHSAWCRDLTTEALVAGRPQWPALIGSSTEALSLKDRLLRVRTMLQDDEAPAAPTEPGLADRGAGRWVIPFMRSLMSVDADPVRPTTTDLEGNLGAVMHLAHADRSLSFVMAQRPPRSVEDPAGLPEEASRHGADVTLTPMPTDHGLALLEPPDWVLDLHVADEDDGGGIALQHVLAASEACNFPVLTIQGPTGAPRSANGAAAAAPRWFHLRVGVPYRRQDTLGAVRRFMDAVAIAGGEDGHVIVVEASAQSIVDGSQDLGEDALMTSSRTRHDTTSKGRGVGTVREDWRRDAIAVYAPVRVGLVHRAFVSLREVAPGCEVLAVESGVFGGLSVIFIVLARPVDARQGTTLARELEARLRRDHGDAGVSSSEAPDARARTYAPGHHDHRDVAPCLEVYVRTPDRPGAVVKVITEVERALARELPPGSGGPNLDLALAHGEVVDSSFVAVRLVARLPRSNGVPPVLSRARRASMERALAIAIADISPAVPQPWLDGTVVRLALLP